MKAQKLQVVFYRTDAGNEPVRVFLKEQSAIDKHVIGTDIKTVQFGWPLGMPLVRKLHDNLWEVRCSVSHGIVRVLFTVMGNNLVLLHAF
ncbi:MAG: type II toxin-antitoxin system RelE/ParE family toxin, partial [Moraxellaceae bacterium]|nr:type II toxin-antitoxin system RelE/ParE family toxin [Moraxellaceae bacterium]